ncbi:hypothetical protein ACIHAA_22515 [Streptomyces sp. NPDC052040]|uniref:hypothetical protein n=1 Tax=unclassified Streptomyces TaxID=2593676 RepID=UPI0037CE540A
MSAFLTATAFLVLVAVAAYVIHRLGLQHADRIAAYRYSTPGPAAAAAARHSRTGAIPAPDRPPGHAPTVGSVRDDACRGVHAGPGPREERPGPVDRGI